MNIPKYIIVHHTAVSYDVNPDQFNATNEYHKKFEMKSSLGFWGGYHYEVSKAGIIRQFRNDNEDGAHTIGKNKESLGICLDGNFDTELPTKEQTETLRKFLVEKCKLYGIIPENIVPHRAFAAKSCYGSKLPDDWARNLLIKTSNPPNEKIAVLEQIVTSCTKLLEIIKKEK